MYTKLDIMKVFFEDPVGEYHIRGIARLTKLNPMTVRKYFNKLTKDGMLLKKETNVYIAYSANTKSLKFRNLKLHYNLEMLRESKLIQDLEIFYDYPTIVLFGSYSNSTNTKDSDIDLCIITNIHKEFNVEKYSNILKRQVSLHKFAEKDIQNMKTKNPELLNNICNGIVISGKLEVV